MKTLTLIRHAKSCWNNNLSDFDRPIKKRGINDANLVSNALVNTISNPDIILCSAANRTRLTAAIFIKNLSLEAIAVKYQKELYDFSGAAVLKVITGIDDAFDNVMVFGHNYALTNFVNTYGNTHIENVTTSGYVKINFEINNWKNLGRGKTEKIVFPKHLK
jgi:phosphohistidine phosphatase